MLKMILLIITCNSYLFNNNRWSFNYLQYVLGNNYNSKFLDLLSKYMDDINNLTDNKLEVHPVKLLKNLSIIASGGVFSHLVYKKKINIFKYIGNAFYLYILKQLLFSMPINQLV